MRTSAIRRVAPILVGLVLTGSAATTTTASAAPRHAHGTVLRGAVIARDAARHTFLLAAPHATDTIRYTASAPAPGTRVALAVTSLADGSFRALGAPHQVGRVVRVSVKAVVVHASTTRLTLSTGTSEFTVTPAQSSRHANSSGGVSLAPGTDVSAEVTITPTGLDASSVVPTGQSALVGLEGVLSSVSPTSITVSSEGGVLTTVLVPSSIVLPTTLSAGAQVEVVSAYASQTFTLVSITTNQSAAAATSQGVTAAEGTDTSTVEAEGSVVAVSPSSVTVQPGDGVSAITFAVPSTVDVSALTVGTDVHLTGVMNSGVLTLTALSVRGPSDAPSQSGDATMTEVEGLVTAFTPATASGPASITVQPDGSAPAVTLSVPASVDVSQVVVGVKVHVRASLTGGTLLVAALKVQVPEGDQGSSAGSGSSPGAPTAPTSDAGNGSTPTSNPDGSSTRSIDATVVSTAPQFVVQPRDQTSPVTVVVPSTVDVSSFSAGESVTVVVTVTNGVTTLVSITAQH